jgi:hypothetical protein
MMKMGTRETEKVKIVPFFVLVEAMYGNGWIMRDKGKYQ